MTLALAPEPITGPRYSEIRFILKYSMISIVIASAIIGGMTLPVLYWMKKSDEAYVRRLNGARAINRISQDYPAVAHLWRQGRADDWGWGRGNPEIIEFGEAALH